MQVMHGNMFLPLNPAVNPAAKPNTNAGNPKTDTDNRQPGGQSFGDILARRVDEKEQLQFSKHAEQRLKSRDIELSQEQMQRAAMGVDKAKAKGIRDSLVLVDDVALVVNTKSNVVITALGSGNDSIFTNIDGAVIV